MRITVLAAIALIATLALLTLSTDTSQARDVMGDWVIQDRTLTLTNETIDVRGNVSIKDGGVLRLEGCELILNSSSSKSTAMYVNATGRLHATGTTIRGAKGDEVIILRGDTEICDCHIRNLGARNYQVTAISCWGGNISIVNTIIEDTNGGCIFAGSDLLLMGCTLRRINGHGINIEARFSPEPFSVQVLQCGITGTLSGGAPQFNGIYVQLPTGAPRLDLCVGDTLVERWFVGLAITAQADCTLLVEDCDLLRNHVGASILQYRGEVNLTGNRIGHDPSDGSIGLNLKGDPRFLSVAGNLVENIDIGYMFYDHSMDADDDESWSGLMAESCRWGLFVSCGDSGHDYRLEVRDSSFRNITDPKGTFVAAYTYGDFTLSVFDTEHTPGSAKVQNERNTVSGYVNLDVMAVGWRNGPPIDNGSLFLTDASSSRQTLRIDELSPVQVMSWQVTKWSSTVKPLIEPYVEMGGHDFMCADIELGARTKVSCTVEVIDDVYPEVTVCSPGDGYLFGVTRVVAKGTCKDLGSGLSHMAFTLDGADLPDRTEVEPGPWAYTLTDLRTGSHVFGARAVDMCGNAGDIVRVAFTVDDLPPFIEVGPFNALVNSPTVRIAGRTEVGSSLTINDMACHVDADGQFSVDVPLSEGPNSIKVRAIDRASNVNSTVLSVVRDTQPPDLRVITPEDGTWTNARSVLVEGYTSLDARLTVNGVPVTFTTGRFAHELIVSEGAFTIAVRAVDPAGNAATVGLTTHVDWTPPTLTMLWPTANLTYTKRYDVQLQGEVVGDDRAFVTINGRPVTVTLGLFMMDLTLLEGVHNFTVLVTDLAGNTACSDLAIVRDLTPPECTVELIPRDGRLVMLEDRPYLTGPTLELHMTANERVRFEGNGMVQGPCRACVFTLRLEEGENVVMVLATDLVGNQAVAYSRRLTLDTTPPRLLLHSPKAGLMTPEEYVVVRGETDPDARLTIGGAVLNQGEYGTFEMRVRLARGTNEIVITVTDAIGNKNTTTLEVTRERGFGPISEDWAASGATVAVLAAVVIVLLLARTRILGGRRSNGPREPSERTDDGEGSHDGLHRKTI